MIPGLLREVAKSIRDLRTDQEWWRQLRLTIACISAVAVRLGRWDASRAEMRAAAYFVAQRLLMEPAPQRESFAEFGDRSRAIDILRGAVGLRAVKLRMLA